MVERCVYMCIHVIFEQVIITLFEKFAAKVSSKSEKTLSKKTNAKKVKKNISLGKKNLVFEESRRAKKYTCVECKTNTQTKKNWKPNYRQ
jgi:hypothetical protein